MSDFEIDNIINDIEFFDDWEDKYKYIIDLGKNFPSLPETEKNDKNKVNGCASQVWFLTEEKTNLLRGHVMLE